MPIKIIEIPAELIRTIIKFMESYARANDDQIVKFNNHFGSIKKAFDHLLPIILEEVGLYLVYLQEQGVNEVNGTNIKDVVYHTMNMAITRKLAERN